MAIREIWASKVSKKMCNHWQGDPCEDCYFNAMAVFDQMMSENPELMPIPEHLQGM